MILGGGARPGYDATMREGRTNSWILGVALLAIGLWYFADRTLGLAMPHLNWNQLWPIGLIAMGAWILAGPYHRRR